MKVRLHSRGNSPSTLPSVSLSGGRGAALAGIRYGERQLRFKVTTRQRTSTTSATFQIVMTSPVAATAPLTPLHRTSSSATVSTTAATSSASAASATSRLLHGLVPTSFCVDDLLARSRCISSHSMQRRGALRSPRSLSRLVGSGPPA